MNESDIREIFEKMKASKELIDVVENADFIHRDRKRVLNYKKIVLPLVLLLMLCVGTGGVAMAVISNKKYTSRLKIYSENYSVLGKKSGWYQEEIEDKLSIYIYYTKKTEVEKNDIYVMKDEASFYTAIDDGNLKYEDFQVFDSELMDEWAPTLNLCLEKSKLKKIYNHMGQIIGFVGEADEERQGFGAVYLISASCTRPKKALKLLDYMVSDEGYLTAMYGPEGICWDVNENGRYYLTDKGKIWFENPDAKIEGFGRYTDGKIDIPNVWNSKHIEIDY